MSDHKIIQIPVPTYIYKYLQASKSHDFLEELYQYKTITYLNQKIDCLYLGSHLYITTRKQKGDAYLSNIKPGTPYIYVQMIRPSISKIYLLVQDLDRVFKRQFLQEMRIAVGIRHQEGAMGGLKDFFDKCDISEADYKISRAYKYWQRKQKQKHKRITDAA